MPTVRVKCPGCGAVFTVDKPTAGQPTSCPTCGQEMIVPSPGAPPIAAPPAPPIAAPAATPPEIGLQVVHPQRKTREAPRHQPTATLTAEEKARRRMRANVVMLVVGVVTLLATLMLLLYVTGEFSAR